MEKQVKRLKTWIHSLGEIEIGLETFIPNFRSEGGGHSGNRCIVCDERLNVDARSAPFRWGCCSPKCYIYLMKLARKVPPSGVPQCLKPDCNMPCCLNNNNRGYYDYCGKSHVQSHNGEVHQIFSVPSHQQHHHHHQGSSKKNGQSKSKSTTMEDSKRVHSGMSSGCSGPILFYNRDEPYYEFTNFADYPIVIGDRQYLTSEHYFQSQKLVGTPYEGYVALLPRPRNAFEFPRQPYVAPWVRKDWQEVKEQVMYRGLYHKFTQYPELKQMLLKTRNRVLIEHSPYDSYWGDGADGKGMNRLGELLMKLRGAFIGYCTSQAHQVQVDGSNVHFNDQGQASRMRTGENTEELPTDQTEGGGNATHVNSSQTLSTAMGSLTGTNDQEMKGGNTASSTAGHSQASSSTVEPVSSYTNSSNTRQQPQETLAPSDQKIEDGKVPTTANDVQQPSNNPLCSDLETENEDTTTTVTTSSHTSVIEHNDNDQEMKGGNTAPSTTVHSQASSSTVEPVSSGTDSSSTQQQSQETLAPSDQKIQGGKAPTSANDVQQPSNNPLHSDLGTESEDTTTTSSHTSVIEHPFDDQQKTDTVLSQTRSNGVSGTYSNNTQQEPQELSAPSGQTMKDREVPADANDEQQPSNNLDSDLETKSKDVNDVATTPHTPVKEHNSGNEEGTENIVTDVYQTRSGDDFDSTCSMDGGPQQPTNQHKGESSINDLQESDSEMEVENGGHSSEEDMEL